MVAASERPFLDTNVLFSGLYNTIGPPAAILDFHVQRRLRIVISMQLLDELVRTIERKKPELLPRLTALLTNAPPELVDDPSDEQVQRVSSYINLTDAPILAVALSSGADCIVTGNTRHFTQEVARQAKIAIFTPAAYLATLQQRS